MTTILIIIAVCYCLVLLYLHSGIMQTCRKQDNVPASRKVVGIITDTRPNNLINKDLK